MSIAKPSNVDRVAGLRFRGNQAVRCLCIGDANLPSDPRSVNVVVIGHHTPEQLDFVSDSVVIGGQAASAWRNGNGNVIIGNLSVNAMEHILHITALGDATLRFLETGIGICAIGYIAGEHLLDCTGSNYIGSYCAAYPTGGDFNNVVGYYGGAHDEFAGTSLGDHCNGMGCRVMRYAEGDYLIGMGTDALFRYKGQHSIGLGNKTGYSVTSPLAANNIFVGQNSGNADGFQKPDARNTICIGTGTYSTRDNEVVLGGPSITRTNLSGSVFGPDAIHFTGDTSSTGRATYNGPSASNYGNGLLLTSGSGLGLLVANHDKSIYTMGLTNAGVFSLYRAGLHSVAGDWVTKPSVSVTLTENTQLAFQRNSNTEIVLKLRGDDGVTRTSVPIAMA